MKLQPLLSWICLLVSACAACGQSISGFTPQIGSVGDMVNISGSGFANNQLVVKFNGTRDPNAYATQSNLIQAQVPGGASTGRISVQVNNGGTVYSALNYTVVGPAPYITNFFPVGGGWGTLVTIRGLHMDQVTGVYFNSKSAAITQQDYNQVQATVPNGATSGPIMVTSSLGNFTTSSNFAVAPVLTGFSPKSGRAGTNVLITGTNFLGAYQVLFNGLASDFVVLSNRAILATVPSNAMTGLIHVDNAGGGSQSPSNFVVLPTIYSFSPGSGAANTNVVLIGANFPNTNGTLPSVYFNGVPAASVSGVSFGQLTARVPAAATTGLISISNLDGKHTNEVPFYIRGSITSFAPTNGPAGTWVKISGLNLTGATNVSFGDVAAATYFVTNNTTLGVLVPPGAITGPITVTTPAGPMVSPDVFYAAPVIDSFTPTHGLPGTNVTIYGTNLLGATAVRFNGLDAASFVATNNGFLRAVVPVNAQAGPITVVGPGGTNSSADPFILDYSDLGVSVTASTGPVFVSSNLTFTITITNAGPVDAPNLKFTNSLPVTVTLVSAATDQGTLVTNTSPVSGTLSSLPVGGTWTITLEVRPNVAGNVTNIASITSGYMDLVPGNNSATNVVYVLPLPLLSIQLLTNYVRLSWPLALSNLNVESRTGLAATNYWSNLTALVSRTTNANVVTQAVTDPLRFYRLKQ